MQLTYFFGYPHPNDAGQSTIASLALAIFGVVLADTAVMQRIAEVVHERLSQDCKMSSYERRLQRLIANDALEVQGTWQQFLAHSLSLWDKRSAVLVLDCTPYHRSFTMIYVGVLVQKRLLPVAWELMPQSESWQEGQWQIVHRLFEQVARSLPSQHVTLLADRSLTCLTLIRLCE